MTRTSLIRQHGDFIRQGLTIDSITRLRNTIVGSPRWLIRFTDATFAETQRGASIGFTVTSLLGCGPDRGALAGAGNLDSDGPLLDVAFTRAGKIRDMVPS